MWIKRKEPNTVPCNKCGELILVGEERLIEDTGDIISYSYHLDCREEEFKNYQLSVKQKADKCFSELRQTWDDLEPKVENKDLEVNDVKRVYALKKEISELLKTKGIEGFDLTYCSVEVDFNNLRKSLTDLDNFLEDNASPQIQDKASSDKKRTRKGNKKCYHENIEPYENDPNYYCCSYCWDDKSPEFLEQLTRKGLKQGEKKPNDPEREREREQIRRKIKRLEKKTNRTPEEESELENLKNKLKELENNTENKPFNYTPWIIGGSVLVGGIIILVLVFNKNRKKHYY